MQPGTVLRDKYQLVASIGRGGMGEVFHAIHLPSGTDVALKVVNREIVDDMMMARLEREAAAATRIQSPYVPRLLDVDRLETRDLFLVMELLHGETLSERLKRGGILSWDEVFHIGDNVLRGLIDAHDAGVIHRDLKPGNIFIEHLDQGMARARILDFGVCKLDEADTKKLTITGESVGTIAYMAPEQIRGASKVDERADLYSFAMIVYEALCGRIPYDAQGQMALLATKLERPARPLKGHNQVAVPPGLDALLTRALSRKPGDRPANGREMLRAWQALGPATTQPSPPPPTSPTVTGPGSSPPTQVAVTAGVRSTLSGPKRKPAIALGAVITVALGLLIVTAIARRSPAASSTTEEGVIVPAAAESGSSEARAAAPTNMVEAPPPVLGPVMPTVAPDARAGGDVVELDDSNARASASASLTPAPAPKHTVSAAPRPKPASAPKASAPAAPPSPSPPPHKSGPTIVETPRY